jgi:hypothetical protein
VSAALRDQPSLFARVGRTLGIMLVFVAVGPPIGGVAFWVFALAAEAVFGQLGSKFAPLYELRMMSVHEFIGWEWISFAIGVVPIGLAGLAVGIRQAFFGPAPWWMALGTGLLVGLGFAQALGFGFDFDSFEDAYRSARYPAFLAPTFMVSIMACWGLVRNWHFAPAALGAVP